MSDPRITEIHVKGMRTLADVRLTLDGLTVLIGDNGSGKSSLIEACELLRRAGGESFADDLRKIHGGTRSLLRAGSTELTLEARVASGGQGLLYSFTLDENGAIAAETLKTDEDTPAVVLARSERGDPRGSHVTVAGTPEPGWYGPHLAATDLGIASFGRNPPHEAIAAVVDALRAIDVHLPFDAGPRWAQRSRGAQSPLRDPAVIEHTDALSRFGGNLANAFFTLKNDFSEAHWRETMDYVRLGLGQDVESVNTRADPGGGSIALRLKYTGLDEQIPAFSLSDGMLSYLCFVALYRLDAKRSLLAFDEPEAHLHPELLMRVLDFFEALAAKRPILLATHSDRLLDGLSDPARSVVLCQLDAQRQTKLVRPDPDALANWLREYRGLGDVRGAGHASSVLIRREAS